MWPLPNASILIKYLGIWKTVERRTSKLYFIKFKKTKFFYYFEVPKENVQNLFRI